MTSNLLNNKFFQVLLIALAAGIVILILIFASGGGNKIIDNGGENKNPNYKRLHAEIDALLGKKWNKSTFNLINQNIDRYASSKLITADESRGLKQVLETNYLTVLADTIKMFCRKAGAGDIPHLNELEKEAKLFQSGQASIVAALLPLVSTFRSILYLKTTITTFTTTQKYDPSAADGYRKSISMYLSSEYFSENTYLGNILRSCRVDLGSHENINNLFELYVRNGRIKTCDCKDKFSRNTYYLNSCNSTPK